LVLEPYLIHFTAKASVKHPLTALKTLAALAAAFAASSLAQADPITGGIAFSGTPTFINGDTAVSFSGVSIGGGTGSFAGVTADAGSLSFSTIILDPLALPKNNLWQFTDDGVLYSFQATSIDFSSPPSQPVWDLSGGGTITIANGTDTPTFGTWSITYSDNNILQFEATTGTQVPDSGATALLLALGVASLCVFERRSRLSKA
jgi:hypothetical protein